MAVQSAWQTERLKAEQARNLYSKTGPVARFLAGKPPIKSPPKDTFAKLNETLNRQMQKAINDAIKSKTPGPSLGDIRAAAEAGKRLHFNGGSTAFASLDFQDGIVTATFTNGYGPYTAPLDLETFLEWVSDDSVGGFYNKILGQDWFGSKSKGR